MRCSVRILRSTGLCLALLLGPVIAQDDAPGDDEAPLEAGQVPVETETAPAAETETAPPNWLETRITIEELLEAGDIEAAEALREQLITLATEEFGAGSIELAEAYLLLAQVYRSGQNYLAAEESIVSAIDIYTAEDGPLSATLIDPYLELGDNYDEAGDYASAISAYGEARTIGRRIYGLLNQDQLVIIDQMAAAAEKLGEVEEARELQLEALTLIERTSDEFSLESIDARYKYATWLREHQRYEEERRFYYLIQRIIGRYYDDDPLMYARMMRERAASFRHEDNNDATGIGGLRESLEMLGELPEPPTLLMAEILLEIGDWTVEFSRTGVTGTEYVQAWEMLGRVQDGNRLRREWFDELTVLEMGAISMRGLSTDPDDPLGFVEIRFTVDQNGRARDIEVVDSRPPGLKDDAIVRLYREARFRPRVEDGQLVSVRRGRRNEFRYLPVGAADAG